MGKVPRTVLNMIILYFMFIIAVAEGLIVETGRNASKLRIYKNIQSRDDTVLIDNPNRYKAVPKSYKFFPVSSQESLLGNLFEYESPYKGNQRMGKTNVSYGFIRKKRSVNKDVHIVPGMPGEMKKKLPAKYYMDRKQKGSPRSLVNGKNEVQWRKNLNLSRKKIDEKNKKNDGNGCRNARCRFYADARRLIASKDAMIEDFPYVVSIQKDGQHWCTGSLLNQRLIISTANCFWKTKRINRMRIRAGSRHVHEGGQMAKINEVIRHPYWSIRGLPDYDVALAYLDRNIRFSDRVHSVDLPNRAMMPPFEDAWVSGWGTERRDGVYTRSVSPVALQVHHARLMDHAKCNNITMRYGMPLTDNFICLSQSGKRAPCTRDTGSPAVSDGVVWGLASWGIRKLCGTERFPAMYSYLASPSNMDFIINATHLLMSEERKSHFPDRLPLNG